MSAVHVKICGITNIEDGIVAAEAGADLLGFIFYPKSPRYVTLERAAEIAAVIRTHAPDIRLVGVFVDEPVEHVRRVLDTCGLDLAQLHGSEPPVEVELLAPRAFKAIRPQGREEAEAAVATYAQAIAAGPQAPALLIDAYDPWRFGGTGEQASWHAAKVLARRMPILLAGGLTPENVAEAIEVIRPWGVDVSSGVEARPGKKDPERVRAFIRHAKAIQL